MAARLKSLTAGKGKYSVSILREFRCYGCGALCANLGSLRDHQMFCEQVAELHELTPLRDAVFVRGDLRVYK